MSARSKGQVTRQKSGTNQATPLVKGKPRGKSKTAAAVTEVSREQRLERIIKQLRERETLLRARLDRARFLIQSVGDQMAEAFVQIDARTDAAVAAAEFRALAWQELDIESAIAQAIDHMAIRFGACNIAVWLASSRGDFAIAGYGYFDVPRTLAEASLGILAQEMCPLLEAGTVGYEVEDGSSLFTVPPPGGGVLNDRRVILCPLAHRGEILGAVMLFRSAESPWPMNAQETAAAIGEAFGEQLSRIIRVSNRGPDRWPHMDND